jgi:hypothetical protein
MSLSQICKAEEKLKYVPQTDLADSHVIRVPNRGNTGARQTQTPFPELSAQVDGAVDTSGDALLRKAQAMWIEKLCPVNV